MGTTATAEMLLLLALVLAAAPRVSEAQENEDSVVVQKLAGVEGGRPVLAAEGADALLTCVTRNLGENTLMWKYGSDKLLSAGTIRVTPDKRISVIHDEGGDVFVLSISEVTMNDTGTYLCEVNTDPPTRSFHNLQVLSRTALRAPSPPPNTSTSPSKLKGNSSTNVWGFSTERPLYSHDYTECCKGAGVRTRCLGFCSIDNIMEGAAGQNPSACEPDFKKIVRCMADGRNHVPCCKRAGVPDICRDMCYGEYSVHDDDARSHVACNTFTAPTLACIAEGINILPARPEELEVTRVTESDLTLEWKVPQTTTASRADMLKIRVNEVMEMLHDSIEQRETAEGKSNILKTYRVSGASTAFNVTGLKPFTLYNISMIARNKNGESLPTYSLRVMTHALNQGAWRKQDASGEVELPPLPDTRGCCLSKNITHKTCIDTFCDAKSIVSATIPDLMVCASWAGDMLGCLFDGRDHTDCCVASGVPSICSDICAGNATDIDFRHFRCVQHMPEITNCALADFGVLPSQPRNFRFSNVGPDIGLLHWDAPLKLSDSVTDYVVHVRKMSPKPERADREFASPRTTFVLEALAPGSTYECFVEARNDLGVGEPSPRIVFRTANRPKADEDLPKDSYNATSCCVNAGVMEDCYPLCRHDVSMRKIRGLAQVCASDISKLAKCVVGGRDHLPCCQRRGVPSQCQLFCQGVMPSPETNFFATCMPYIGNMLTCLEEGTTMYPPPVKNFHAIFVGDDQVTVEWDAVEMAEEDNAVLQYEVYYKEISENATSVDIYDGNENLNVTKGVTTAVVDGLNTGKRHHFFVIARNQFGTSLPSSVVTLNVTSTLRSESVKGRPSAPHGLMVAETGIDYLSVAWSGPAISDPEDSLKYKLHYLAVRDQSQHSTSVESTATTATLKGLRPNARYVIFVQTVNGAGAASEPSETVVAWTDPIVPAFAEPPAIQPRSGVREGDSITVLCIALGTPTPTVTLYIAGHPIRSTTSRHMVTTIHNVTRLMSSIACHADNGYGTPMHAQRSIQISRAPKITVALGGDSSNKSPGADETTPTRKAYEGTDLLLLCRVDSFPTPTISVGKNGEGLHTSERVSIEMNSTDPIGSEDDSFTVRLSIKNIVMSDAGIYYCRANNSVGEDYQDFKVNVAAGRRRNPDVGGGGGGSYGRNTETCCHEQNVSSSCIGACSLSIDLDFLLYRPECFEDFNKLMFCASDGSDHRHCCSVGGVPRNCLDWCRGIPVAEGEFCALSHARKISRCFDGGRYTLPSPPRNVRVTPVSENSVRAEWEQPEKNAEMVELYRIMWREEGARHAAKMDTPEKHATLENLAPGATYELVVKAGNSNGTSQLTSPLKFVMAKNYIVQTTNQVYSPVPSVVAILVALLLIVPLVAFVVWYFKMRRKSTTSGGILSDTDNNTANAGSGGVNQSFENPYLNQEITMSHLQASEDPVATVSAATTASPFSATPPPTSSSSSSERNPSLFEKKFRLGKSGEGFQRFE